ncbi:putative nucleotide exchange factor sil1 [Erysiphe neolycopersici]|uniref:Nucleotide exchange factor SIL1 n=1 Tax=Erysiphe neolycopersici TaxID=212602 RepID=A0A420HUW9_9PEZI|nr:putative nucleotide exchange factor sil1 [Erysiphe neolycopersici]
MNIYTGEKEARLNVPMMEEDDISLDGAQPLSMETALITAEEENNDQKYMQHEESIKITASQGKIQLPKSQSELQTFQSSIAILKMRGSLFDQALEDLSELAHDIYYGREIVREDSILELLVCLMLGLEPEDIPNREINRERTAASVLGSAFQNNPAAIEEIDNAKKNIIYPSCTPNLANKIEEDNFISIFRKKLEKEQDAHNLKIKITTLSRLLKSNHFRGLFLENEGMELILAVFLKRGENFNTVKKKISELLIDNFLDESYGAQVNIWPKLPRSSKRFCEKSKNLFHDGCWEHHIEEFSTQVPTEDWPKNLLLALKSRRPKKISLKTEI